MKTQTWSLLIGFSIWLTATLVFSFWGNLFFNTATLVHVLAFYGLPIPLLFLLVRFIFKSLRLAPKDRLQNTILLCLPGICLDVLCFRYAAWVFPYLSTELSLQLSSMVLWIYAIALISGLYLQNKSLLTHTNES